MADDDDTDDARNLTALLPLYDEWARGRPGEYALVARGTAQGVYGGQDAARRALLALPDVVGHAFIMALWPLPGWRHPRLVVDSYRRIGAPRPTLHTASDPLAADILAAEGLRRDAPTAEDVREPYLLVKDGAVLARYRRVTQARQAIDAAHPPLAPIVFTSLRPGHIGPFTIMVLQLLVR